MLVSSSYMYLFSFLELIKIYLIKIISKIKPKVIHNFVINSKFFENSRNNTVFYVVGA